MLVVDIFERSQPFPILTHLFRGRTQQQAEGYFRSHMTTDRFLSDCVTHGRWKDVECRAEKRWETSR